MLEGDILAFSVASCKYTPELVLPPIKTWKEDVLPVFLWKEYANENELP